MKIYNKAFFRLLLSILVMCAACNEKEQDDITNSLLYKHDVSKPVSIEGFTPQKGGRDTEVIIHGDNFSSRSSEIKVTINGVTATVHESSQKKIVITVPDKAGSGKINVTIGSSVKESASPFEYVANQFVRTFAGSGIAGFKDGAAADAQFNFSMRGAGIVTDAAGNVYVADIGNHAIRKITPDGMVSTLAGNGNAGSANGTGSAATFYHPYGLAIDKQGDLLVADTWNWQIRKVTPQGVVTIFGAVPDPCGITVDQRNNDVYCISYARGKIHHFSSDGTLIEEINVGGESTMLGDLEIDSKGNLFVVDNVACALYKLTANTWLRTTIAGSVYGFKDGVGVAAQFASPWGIGIDQNDNLYLGGTADNPDNLSPDHGVRFVEADSWVVSTLAGSAKGFVNGSVNTARFSSPADVAVTKTGIIYVLDRNNQRIRKIVSE